MTYLQRIHYRPSLDNVNPTEERFLTEHFEAYGAEMVFDGQALHWEHIEEVEVVIAPRIAGPAGWIVKYLFLRGETRYHLGIYYGSREVILPNITWNTARYVLQNIAFYAPNPIIYKGPEELVDLSEI